MELKKRIAQIWNTRDIENISSILGSTLGGRIKKLIKEADRADKELDIVHECLTKLYNYENVTEIVKGALDKIAELPNN